MRNEHALFVTLINKAYGPIANEAAVAIRVPGILGRAEGMALAAPRGDVAARTGVTLGGAAMTTDAWNGRWTDLGPCAGDRVEVHIPAASARVVRLEFK